VPVFEEVIGEVSKSPVSGGDQNSVVSCKLGTVQCTCTDPKSVKKAILPRANEKKHFQVSACTHVISRI